MTPTVTYIAAQTHLDDLYRDAQRHRRVEQRVRQMITREPSRQVTRGRGRFPSLSKEELAAHAGPRGSVRARALLAIVSPSIDRKRNRTPPAARSSRVSWANEISASVSA
jgi:hypothetical protein